VGGTFTSFYISLFFAIIAAVRSSSGILTCELFTKHSSFLRSNLGKKSFSKNLRRGLTFFHLRATSSFYCHPPSSRGLLDIPMLFQNQVGNKIWLPLLMPYTFFSIWSTFNNRAPLLIVHCYHSTWFILKALNEIYWITFIERKFKCPQRYLDSWTYLPSSSLLNYNKPSSPL
jgi:hypothetical protein